MKYHITPTSSGLAWKTCQLAYLACEQCQIPNMLLPHDVCCVWHRSHLISVPCQWNDFLKNCWPKKGRLQSFLLVCTLLFLHSKGAALLFSSQHPALPMESLGRYWHCWCFHGEQRCSMEKRLPGSTSNPGIWHTEESWKEQWGNSISRAGKAVVERRVSLLLPLSVATQLKICERRQARRFWCYFY